MTGFFIAKKGVLKQKYFQVIKVIKMKVGNGEELLIGIDIFIVKYNR
jgi:hypothetical protein